MTLVSTEVEITNLQKPRGEDDVSALSRDTRNSGQNDGSVSANDFSANEQASDDSRCASSDRRSISSHGRRRVGDAPIGPGLDPPGLDEPVTDETGTETGSSIGVNNSLARVPFVPASIRSNSGDL